MRCSDGTIYTGISTNVERRVREHNSSKRGAKYTSTRRPVELLNSWKIGSQGDAMRVERAFKKLSRKQKKARIASGELVGLL